MAAARRRNNDPARARSFPGTNVEEGSRMAEDIRKSLAMHQQSRMGESVEDFRADMRFSGHVDKLSEIRDSLQPFANRGAPLTTGGFGLNEESVQTLVEMGFDRVGLFSSFPLSVCLFALRDWMIVESSFFGCVLVARLHSGLGTCAFWDCVS